MPSPTVVTDLTGGHLALMVRLEQYADLVTKFIWSGHHEESRLVNAQPALYHLSISISHDQAVDGEGHIPCRHQQAPHQGRSRR